MSQSKSMSGSRALLEINGKIVGVFASVDYDYALGVTPVYTLGRFGPQELAYTDASPINVNCSGFRIIDGGPHKIAGVPHLQDLLAHEDISLSLYDRKGDGAGGPKQIMRVEGVRPTGYSQSVAGRGLQDLRVSFMGLAIADEDGDQGEPGASTL